MVKSIYGEINLYPASAQSFMAKVSSTPDFLI